MGEKTKEGEKLAGKGTGNGGLTDVKLRRKKGGGKKLKKTSYRHKFPAGGVKSQWRATIKIAAGGMHQPTNSPKSNPNGLRCGGDANRRGPAREERRKTPVEGRSKQISKTLCENQHTG